MMTAKPAPPPPKFGPRSEQHAYAEVREPDTHRLEHYALPMRSAYNPEWREILREAGYPTDVLVLDFETYFDDAYSMRGNKLGTVEYIQDPRFEVLGVAALIVKQPFIDYEAQTQWYAGEADTQRHFDWLQQAYGQDWGKLTVVAQNATFDGAILAFRYDIHPRYFIDELGLARHWNSRTRNDLDTLAKRYKLPEKGDTADFKEATFRPGRRKKPRGRTKQAKLPVQIPVMGEEQALALGQYARNDVMREWELFTLLLPKLSTPGFELRIMQHTLELFWKPRLWVDPKKGLDLVEQMEAEIDKTVEAAGDGLTRQAISGETTFEALLEERLRAADPDDPRPLNGYTKPAKNNKGWKFAIAKDDPERELLEAHQDPAVRSLIAARNAVKSWPLHIARIERIARQAEAMGWPEGGDWYGPMPVPLRYHGAHTGRWSGAEKINLQNLGSRGHPLVSAVREMLVAPTGETLVIADASQIEARVLAWIADQQDLAAKFENGDEIYCRFAEKVLGKPEGYYRKPRADGIPAVEKRHKWARNTIGKVGVLGCGYGMGASKAIAFAGGELDVATAERLVATYREENAQIKQFWYDLERAFRYTAKYGRPCEMPRGLRFYTRPDCDVVIALPNGREIKYHTVRTAPGKFGDSVQVWNDQEKKWTHTWGGSFCLAGGTPVLTDRGWIPLEKVPRAAWVWDGVDWVRHTGVVFNGYRPTLEINGLEMTDDHEILTRGGWLPAGAASQAHWKNFRMPDGNWAFAQRRSPVVLDGAVPVRAKVGGVRQRPDSQEGHPGLSLLLEERKKYHARDDEPSGLLGLAVDAGSLPLAYTPGVAQLRGPGNQGVRTMGKVRELLGRYGAGLPARAHPGPDQQRRQLRAGELPVGNLQAAGKQQAVFDLTNCGPRNRYAVRDAGGTPRLVHNCENVVQAMARDILAEAMLKLEDQGYRVALHVHDELVLCVPQAQGEHALKQAITALSTRPDWAPDCPLAAEGVIRTRYGDH